VFVSAGDLICLLVPFVCVRSIDELLGFGVFEGSLLEVAGESCAGA